MQGMLALLQVAYSVCQIMSVLACEVEGQQAQGTQRHHNRVARIGQNGDPEARDT